jgi:hypothetical protein
MYFILSKILISTVHYEDDIKVLRNLFTKDEVYRFQKCTEGTTDITQPCFKNFHRVLVKKIKNRLDLDYIKISHARFSNNTNHDGKSFHRDTKPLFLGTKKYPKVYTIICYLDRAKFQIGDTVIEAEPGDIVIFNTFYLHRSLDVNVIEETKNRRILQLFEVFFDKESEVEFKKVHSYCSYNKIDFLVKYLFHFFDSRIFLEYFNFSHMYSNNCTKNNPMYRTFLNEKNYMYTIDDTKYYINI